jgi:hypothetical protein
MDLNEIVLNGNNQAWLVWTDENGRQKGDVEILIEYLPPTRDSEMRRKIMKAQWRGQQNMIDEIDPVALRNFYCEQVIKGVRGLTKDGAPFEPTVPELKMIWDGNRDFQIFVVRAAQRIENFIAEKKS